VEGGSVIWAFLIGLALGIVAGGFAFEIGSWWAYREEDM